MEQGLDFARWYGTIYILNLWLCISIPNCFPLSCKLDPEFRPSNSLSKAIQSWFYTRQPRSLAWVNLVRWTPLAPVPVSTGGCDIFRVLICSFPTFFPRDSLSVWLNLNSLWEATSPLGSSTKPHALKNKKKKNMAGLKGHIYPRHGKQRTPNFF